ncbi:hypothetical protein H5410_023361 [Solanum commersonii]|uniref:Uncharacterized protein n=1 Tax=Solanum commersonii TaxID=4109 RepID=A0A9J5ZJ67_SOLCO|nr:hypothetical protein H5410_023361 [Solanum commersonii]
MQSDNIISASVFVLFYFYTTLSQKYTSKLILLTISSTTTKIYLSELGEKLSSMCKTYLT